MKIVIVVILFMSMVLLAAEDQKKIVEVNIEKDTLSARIDIPDGMHLAKQEDFVYVDADSVAGLKLGETIWQDGGHKDELGIINYDKELVLKRNMSISDSLKTTGFSLKVYVGYQMCFDNYCEPPEELEFEINYRCTENVEDQ